MDAKRACMLEYLIAGLQYMTSFMMSLERWMIVIEKLEPEEIEALAIVLWLPFWMSKKGVITSMVEVKKLTPHQDIGNYPQEYIVFLEPF